MGQKQSIGHAITPLAGQTITLDHDPPPHPAPGQRGQRAELTARRNMPPPRKAALLVSAAAINGALIWAMALPQHRIAPPPPLVIDLTLVDTRAPHPSDLSPPHRVSPRFSQATKAASPPPTTAAETLQETAPASIVEDAKRAGLERAETARRIARTLARRRACQIGAQADAPPLDCPRYETRADIGTTFRPTLPPAFDTPTPRAPDRDCPGANLGAGCAGGTTWTVFRKQW